MMTYTSSNQRHRNLKVFYTLMMLLSILVCHQTYAKDQTKQLSATNAMPQDQANSDQQAAAKVLDLLNEYSSHADWDRYFALYRADAIFIGTDANERWGMEEFERYSRPTTGWRYDLTKRALLQYGDVMLFDELLTSPTYGVSRGTGTLIKTDGKWKIAQYHLSFPIPNAIAKQIMAEIKVAAATPSDSAPQ